jgi:thiol-disulfide isomerase/thioredoxin
MLIRLFIAAVLVAFVFGLRLRYARAQRIDAATGADGLLPLPAALVARKAPTWVIFTTPLCVSCDAVAAELTTAYPSDEVVKVDATEEPQLAERYAVRRAPTVIHADRTGRVVLRLVGADAVHAHVAA